VVKYSKYLLNTLCKLLITSYKHYYSLSKFGVLGCVLYLLQGHRNEKVQALEESKVCAKWFHKKFNRWNLMVGILRLQSIIPDSSNSIKIKVVTELLVCYSLWLLANWDIEHECIILIVILFIWLLFQLRRSPWPGITMIHQLSIHFCLQVGALNHVRDCFRS